MNPKTCHIDTEYLTGYNADVQLEKGECKRMFWTPTKEEARLHMLHFMRGLVLQWNDGI